MYTNSRPQHRAERVLHRLDVDDEMTRTASEMLADAALPGGAGLSVVAAHRRHQVSTIFL